MGFSAAVKNCLKKYATFSGRASRSEFWWFYLFASLVGLVDGMSEKLGLGLIVGLITGFSVLAIVIPSFAVVWRRLHDTGRNGWWFFAPLLSGAVVFLGVLLDAKALATLGGIGFIGQLIQQQVWFCTRGTEGPNRFGENPLTLNDPARRRA